MAKQDQIQPRAAAPLRGEGQDESNPVMLNGAFFRTNGLIARDGATWRLAGKLLSSIAVAPVTAIHSNRQGLFWVQTSGKLYMMNHLGDGGLT